MSSDRVKRVGIPVVLVSRLKGKMADVVLSSFVQEVTISSWFLNKAEREVVVVVSRSLSRLLRP